MPSIYPFLPNVYPVATEVCRLLQQAGHQAYIVGGCVRDLILGEKPKDWDIAASATPEQIIQIFPRTLPTGLQHGTVTVCMGEGIENHFEVTTFREEGDYLDGRRPTSVKFVKRLIDDLARRDLTINAMAYDPVNQKLEDPWGGLCDIKEKLIRAVGSPHRRFTEDGLRIMRVARFAGRFNYKLHPQTFEGMRDSLETLKKVSKERISDELSKTLMTKYPSRGIAALQECGALDIVCPLLVGRYPTIIPKLDQCLGEMETRLALLYGKIPSKAVERELVGLKFSTKEIKRVIFLLVKRIYFHSFEQSGSVVSYRRFIASFKNEAPDPWEYSLRQFIEFGRALGLPIELLDRYQGTVVPARHELAIDGNDLMSLGIEAGPDLKYILDSCYNEILEHPEHNNKEYLLKWRQSIIDYNLKHSLD